MSDVNEAAITPKESKIELIKRYYHVIKDNTAQIAIMIPVLASLCTTVSNYCFYLANLGYYGYFHIDSRLMLPYNKINIYQSIGPIALFMVYWGYTIFAVRMFHLKGNYLWKFITLIIIPMGISAAIMYSWPGGMKLVFGFIFFIILIITQWLLIFAFGFCLVLPYHETGKLEKKKQSDEEKDSEKRERKWGDIECRLLGIIIILGGVIGLFYQAYVSNHQRAENQTKFGVVQIDGDEYALIDANEDKLILQRCETNNDCIKIYVNTYLCLENDIAIKFEKFGNVQRITD